ncbi:MAG: SDR family NAD(P)-dependent oxidoreductase [Victivallaceae bacterium]|nr:SDR family NAD(P)-dependent oxidoreductase [Victivallaceae bacterium]
MKEMQGKNVLITGAGTGIGRGIALTFARAGANLLLHFRSHRTEAEALRRQVEELGGTAQLFQADLSQMAELDALFASIARCGLRLDAAVNNAGWDPGAIPMDQIDEALYLKVMDMNLKGTMFCCLHEIKMMKPFHSGSIINLGSVQMNHTVPGRVLYATSKGGIHSMTGALALEAGPLGIRVNTIAPGYVEVERLTQSAGFDREKIADGIPVGRMGAPSDVGELALFLASSEKSGFLSGETIVLDGGVNRKLARFNC